MEALSCRGALKVLEAKRTTVMAAVLIAVVVLLIGILRDTSTSTKSSALSLAVNDTLVRQQEIALLQARAVEEAVASCEKVLDDIADVLAEKLGRRASPIAKLPNRLQGAPSTFLTSVGPRSAMNDILSPHVACNLLLWKQGNCRIEEEEENMVACVRRVGARNMAKVLPERCRESPFMRAMVQEEENAHIPDDNGWLKLKRTPQYHQQVIEFDAVKPYVPPSERPPHSYTTGPRVCQKPDSAVLGCKMHPIGFHVPKDQIAERVERRKLFDFLPFIPRHFPISKQSPSYTLGVHDEFLSNVLHQHSYFAYTHRRGGWDCLRHLEIMSSGSVAYFPDLIACGKYCMPQMPKDLLAKVPYLPGVDHIGVLSSLSTEKFETEYVELSESSTHLSKTEPKKQMNFKTQGTIDWSAFDEDRYFDLADKLHNFTKTYLGTASLATYMLEVIDYPEPKNVLFLSGTMYRYLIQSVVHGFGELGINYTVFPLDGATQQMREGWNSRTNVSEPLTEAELEGARHQYRSWQGLLYGYGMRTSVSELPPAADVLERRIMEGYYDLVIYPWTVHRAHDTAPVFTKDKPFWGAVSASLPPERIVFVDTTDDVFKDPDEVLLDMCGKGVIFKRSLHDHEC